MSEKKSNIIFITSDQQRADCYGFAGRKISTPHLDKLAKTGSRFDSCITPNLVCQPSRASILTGQLPFTHGVCDNGIDLNPEIAQLGFAEQLNKVGYKTSFIGKAHFATSSTFEPTGTPECKHSSTKFGSEWYGPYMGFKHVELMTLGHWYKEKGPTLPPEGQHFERFVFEEAGGPEIFDIWHKPAKPGYGAAQTWHSSLPVALHSSTWCGDRAISFLNNQNKNEPFCSWVSFPDPHHPFDCPTPWSTMYNLDDVDLPAEGKKDLDNRPWWHKASLESEPNLADPQLKFFRAKLSRSVDQTEKQLREMTANYFGMISLIDHNVGRIILELKRLGMDKNTIIIYSTDHGDLLGDHGLYLKGPTPYEGLLRVGLIVNGPNIPKNKVIKDPVSTMDIAATICDIAGAELPHVAQSKSLIPVIRNNESRDVAHSEWKVNASRCGVELELRTVRTKNAKLTIEKNTGAGEMYDLDIDPNEMTNLFDDDNSSNLKKELMDMIEERPGKELSKFDEPVGMA